MEWPARFARIKPEVDAAPSRCREGTSMLASNWRLLPRRLGPISASFSAQVYAGDVKDRRRSVGLPVMARRELSRFDTVN